MIIIIRDFYLWILFWLISQVSEFSILFFLRFLITLIHISIETFKGKYFLERDMYSIYIQYSNTFNLHSMEGNKLTKFLEKFVKNLLKDYQRRLLKTLGGLSIFQWFPRSPRNPWNFPQEKSKHFAFFPFISI